MESPKDFVTWLQVAKVWIDYYFWLLSKFNCHSNFYFLQCFRIWDLDARGYHNSMWRMRMKGSDVMVIGSPNSEYS